MKKKGYGSVGMPDHDACKEHGCCRKWAKLRKRGNAYAHARNAPKRVAKAEARYEKALKMAEELKAKIAKAAE